MEHSTGPFKTGVIVLSLDMELEWGRLNRPEAPRFRPLYEKTPAVVERILALFEHRGVAATWAVVGGLMDREGPGRGRGRFLEGAGMVEKILQCKVAQEIGSHSFSHPEFDSIPAVEAEDELSRAAEAASAWGLRLRSFVFPRNRTGHIGLLARHGFICYRGVDRNWHERQPELLRKASRQADLLLACTPKVTLPRRVDEGLVEIDGQMPFYIPLLGWKSRIPASLLTRKARKGIEAARRRREVFHLWLHPHDFAFRTEEQLQALDEALELAARLRDEGELGILTMAQLAEAVIAAGDAGAPPKYPPPGVRAVPGRTGDPEPVP